MKGFPENRREILIKQDSSGIKIKAFSSRESNYTTYRNTSNRALFQSHHSPGAEAPSEAQAATHSPAGGPHLQDQPRRELQREVTEQTRTFSSPYAHFMLSYPPAWSQGGSGEANVSSAPES